MSMKKYIIEEIESGVAKCENEDGDFEFIKRDMLPADAKSGDVLVFEDSFYTVSQSETAERKKKMLELQNKLFGKK